MFIPSNFVLARGEWMKGRGPAMGYSPQVLWNTPCVSHFSTYRECGESSEGFFRMFVGEVRQFPRRSGRLERSGLSLDSLTFFAVAAPPSRRSSTGIRWWKSSLGEHPIAVPSFFPYCVAIRQRNRRMEEKQNTEGNYDTEISNCHQRLSRHGSGVSGCRPGHI